MKQILYILIGLFWISCTSNTIYKKPKDLIPKDTMVMLLQDMYIASAAKIFDNLKKERYKPYIHLVYNKYKIDSLRFKKSNIYYTSKITTYEEILNQVKINLDTLVKIKNKEIEANPKLDSIRKVKKDNRIEQNIEEF